MMNARVGLLEDIAQFIGLAHQPNVIVLLEQRFAGSINVMPIVSDFACHMFSIGVMFRVTQQRCTALRWMADVRVGQDDDRLRQVDTRRAQFQFPQVVLLQPVDLCHAPLNAWEERTVGHGENQS